MQLTTLSPPAVIGDLFLWLTLIWGTTNWTVAEQHSAYYALGSWMIFSKFIKLITHFVRYPGDIFLWPVSILFGWYHGLIKCHAFTSLNEVRHIHSLIEYKILTFVQTTWGSRAGADASDSERMVKQQKLYEMQSCRNEKAFMEKLPLTFDFSHTNSQAIAA